MLGHVASLKGAVRDHANARELFKDVRYDASERVRHVNVLTDEQVDALMVTATELNTGLALPIRVAAKTGMRWGELAGLDGEAHQL